MDRPDAASLCRGRSAGTGGDTAPGDRTPSGESAGGWSAGDVAAVDGHPGDGPGIDPPRAADRPDSFPGDGQFQCPGQGRGSAPGPRRGQRQLVCGDVWARLFDPAVLRNLRGRLLPAGGLLYRHRPPRAPTRSAQADADDHLRAERGRSLHGAHRFSTGVGDVLQGFDQGICRHVGHDRPLPGTRLRQPRPVHRVHLLGLESLGRDGLDEQQRLLSRFFPTGHSRRQHVQPLQLIPLHGRRFQSGHHANVVGAERFEQLQLNYRFGPRSVPDHLVLYPNGRWRANAGRDSIAPICSACTSST